MLCCLSLGELFTSEDDIFAEHSAGADYSEVAIAVPFESLRRCDERRVNICVMISVCFHEAIITSLVLANAESAALGEKLRKLAYVLFREWVVCIPVFYSSFAITSVTPAA